MGAGMSPCTIWESGRKGVGIGNLEGENCELGKRDYGYGYGLLSVTHEGTIEPGLT